MIINRFILSIITLLFIDNNSYSKEIKEKQLSAAEKQRLELLDNYKIKRMTKEELQEKAKYLESLPSDDVNKIQLDMKKINSFDTSEIELLMNFSADDYLGKWRDTTGRNYDSTITKTKYGKYHINWNSYTNGTCDIIEQRRNELILRCVGYFSVESYEGKYNLEEFVNIRMYYSFEGRMSIGILFTPSLECAKKHDFMSDECYFKNFIDGERKGTSGGVSSTNDYYKVIDKKPNKTDYN